MTKKKQVIQKLREAIESKQEKDHHEFAKLLFETYYDLLYAKVISMLGWQHQDYANDVVAGFFEKKVLKAKLKNFPKNDIKEFEKVLFTAVHNFCLNCINKQNKELAHKESYNKQNQFSQNDINKANYTEVRIKAYLKVLNIKQQALLWLRAAGLSYERIAASTNVPPGALRDRFSRAKKQILSRFTENRIPHDYRDKTKIESFLATIENEEVLNFYCQILFSEKTSEEIIIDLMNQGKNGQIISLRAIVHLKEYLKKAS